MTREIKYSEAILEATDLMMDLDEAVYLIGLGAPDPKGIFGTVQGLNTKYGSTRVLDMPTSENAMTGIVIGSAIKGMKPIMTHQRVDFFLLGLDQLFNNGAKWHYMFGNQMNVPIVIRLIIGRGWGQGPQHSQSLQSIFAHIPGLKVVMPSNAYDAKGLLISAVQDPNPVIYLEHRWLHGVTGEVPEGIYNVPLGKAKILQEGKDLTIVSTSHMTLEAYKAAKILEKENVSAEVIDLRSIKPLDKETILDSVRKTGKLLVADPDWKFAGISSEVVSTVVEEGFSYLKEPPVRIAYPDRLCPTSRVLASHFYPTEKQIVIEALKMMKKPISAEFYLKEMMKQFSNETMDVPDRAFTGPF